MKFNFFASLMISSGVIVSLAAITNERIGIRFQSRSDENRDVLERYHNLEKKPATVLVGSSLARTLPFGKAIDRQTCEYNLALSGGSARTGLLFLSRSQSLPRQVLIEVNVIDRGPDNGLLNDVSGFRSHFKFLQTRYNPANMILSWIPVRNKVSNDATANSQMFQSAVDFHIKAGNNELDQRSATASIDFLGVQITKLLERGVDVKFVELPVHPSVSSTRKARNIRQMIRGSFPGVPYIWIGRGLMPQLTNTTDGIHLRSDSAELVTAHLNEISAGTLCSVGMQNQ